MSVSSTKIHNIHTDVYWFGVMVKVALELAGTEAVLVLNKTDLLDSSDPDWSQPSQPNNLQEDPTIYPLTRIRTRKHE